MKNDKSETGFNRKNKRNNLETLLKMVQQDALLWEFMNQNYHADAERMKLLHEIILGIGNIRKEELTCQIFRYGSMLKDTDFLARQMFLWLLAMLEENDRELR